jgi:2,4-diaminopentanoate dehydrogenase
MKKYKVIQWGTGWVGMAALKYVLASPQLELVGLQCHTEEKEGKDAGTLAGAAAIGVKATRNVEELVALDADCVIFMPRDVMTDPTVPGTPSSAWVPDLLALLESGKNVIAPFCQMQHYRHLANGPILRDRLNEACATGGRSTVYFTGIDPGFTTDALAFTLSSLCGQIEQVRTFEMLDYSTFSVHSMLTGMGFGLEPHNMSADGLKTVELNWGGSLHLLADAFGVEIEKIEVQPDFRLAPKAFTTVTGFEVREGTIAALKFALIGVVDGQPRFAINHVNVLGYDMAPDWPKVGEHGGYRVEIVGHPSLVSDMALGLPGGTGNAFDDAMTMTAARCVNSIDAVVHADAGYQTFLDLRPIGAKHAFAP